MTPPFRKAGRGGSGVASRGLVRMGALAALGLVLGLLISCSLVADETSPTPVVVPVAGAPVLPAPGRTSTGVAAPDFTLQTFAGPQLTLTDLAGKGVVLNFWASWCPPCRVEMPYFETASRTYRDQGVAFVGVAVRDRSDDAQAFLKKLGITYPNGPDEDGAIEQRYSLIGLPMTVFITRNGEIARMWTGTLSEPQLTTFIEQIAD